jgi:hypothetical protein
MASLSDSRTRPEQQYPEQHADDAAAGPDQPLQARLLTAAQPGIHGLPPHSELIGNVGDYTSFEPVKGFG